MARPLLLAAVVLCATCFTSAPGVDVASASTQPRWTAHAKVERETSKPRTTRHCRKVSARKRRARRSCGVRRSWSNMRLLGAPRDHQSWLTNTPAPQGPPTAGSTPTATSPTSPAHASPTSPAPPVSPGLTRFVSVSAREFSLGLSRPVVGAGQVTVQLQNKGEDPHNLVIGTRNGNDVIARIDSQEPRGVAEAEPTLRPGRYRLWCSLYGHEAAGMRTELEVR